ncbi:hypothetical protein DFH06DRAFT_1318537 [Mycena polygramma]|nr:hypothetical protein DFH06DRAFT_1318537 [Mycena polygramma]
MARTLDSSVAENQCRDLVLFKTPKMDVAGARRAHYLANYRDFQRGERYLNFPFTVKFPVVCPACPSISYDIGCGFRGGSTDGEGVESTWALLNPYMGGKQMAAGSRRTDGEGPERAWAKWAFSRPAAVKERAKL